ncbi:MAG: bifunctional oligoribonuclease/PAP phosphatase NrnA [Deltaproteobacteria bacterium]|nr:MAG: bifunctional oligoribonuclease/PAP phosphatase NrnA [Deltaproteobacteria bacterium]
MRERLEALSHLLMNKRKVLIVTHTNPDPDSIASAYAMRHLFASWGINSVLVYGGIIGRAENKVMINRLRIPLRSIQTVNPFNFKIISLVDAQPSSGNNPLPPSLVPSIVVDHHPARKTSLLKKVPFVDIRPGYGSTSSIMAEYLMESDVDINRRLATALYYGIKSDTRDLGRSANEVDIKISAELYPKVLVKTLSQIEYPRLPREYFRILQKALSRTTWYPTRGVLISELGVIGDPDMVAVVADFLIRVEGIKWVLALAQRDHEIFFSLRTTDYPKRSADRLARALIKGIEGGSAGGHDTTAGGRIGLLSLQEMDELREKLRDRFTNVLGCNAAKEVPFI